MATVTERRLKVRDRYKKYIGRNHYSQARRNYCETKYTDGKYYSDCSSSVSYAYKGVGESFGILNTVGIWTSKKMVDVPVKISKGQITNPEVLRVGDLLLYAGNDTSRKAYGYVGHVEMVGEISGKTVWLYGHGSGLAKRHEMVAYNRTRYNTKASTPLGRRLLIRVRRVIQDDTAPVEPTVYRHVKVTGGAINVRSGPGTKYPIMGTAKLGTVLPYQGIDETVDGTPWHLVEYQMPGDKTPSNAWVSSKYTKVVE